MLLEIRKILLVLGLGVTLAGCSFTDDWFGDEELPPLPGARISIQSVDKGLTADPTISDQRIVLPQPFTNTYWTHNGGNPAHAMFHLSLGDLPREKWSDDIGEESDGDEIILAQPLVVESILFTMDARSTVKAFDRDTGKVFWEKDLDPYDEDDGFFGGGIAYADGRIYVSTGFARVFALDVRSGDVIWTQDAPAPMRAAPTVNGGRVFVITLDNQTLALAADDGRRLWSHIGVQSETSLLGGASAAVAGRKLIVPYSSGEIVAIDVIEGEVKWTLDLSSIKKTDPLTDLAHIRAMPVIDRDRVIAVSHSGRMVAIDLKEGVRLWDTDIGGVQMPWVAGEFIYVLTNDSQVAAVRRQDGRIRWIQPLPRYMDPEDRKDLIVWQGPVLASDRLIAAGSHGEAISLSPYTGEILGYLELPDGAAMPPVVVGNSLYFLTAEAEIIAMQ